jgi:hypothetical protein
MQWIRHPRQTTLLNNGTMLIAGGGSNDGFVDSEDLY